MADTDALEVIAAGVQRIEISQQAFSKDLKRIETSLTSAIKRLERKVDHVFDDHEVRITALESK